MFEQMVRDMYVPPEILLQLTDEQRDVLHYEIRQEQIRRYNEWDKTADANLGTPKSKRKNRFHKQRKKEKHVNFIEGPDGKVIVNKVYVNSTNGYNSDSSVVRYDQHPEESRWNVQIANQNRMYLSDESDDNSSWAPQFDYRNEGRLSEAGSRPIAIVRVLDDCDDHSPPSSTNFNNNYINHTSSNNSAINEEYRFRPTGQSHENLSSTSADNRTQSIRILPWKPSEPVIHDQMYPEHPTETRVSTITTNLRKPTDSEYIRTISIPSGYVPESKRREMQSTPHVSFDSQPPTVLDRQQDLKHSPSGSEARNTVTSRPSNNHSNHCTDSIFNKTASVNGAEDFSDPLSNTDLQDMSDSSDSDIQPSTLQGFPRLSISEPEYPLSFWIRRKPSPQSTPSMPRRAFTSQTFQLKQPASWDSLAASNTLDRPSVSSTGQNRHQQSINSDSNSSLRNSLTLNHRVAPQIQRLTEQLFRSATQPVPTNSVSDQIKTSLSPPVTMAQSVSTTRMSTTVTTATRSVPNTNWFHRNEAANLMREFQLPTVGFNPDYPEQAFAGVPRWFHGTIDRFRAEQLLRQVDLDGAFLVRVDPSAQRYVISLLWAGRCSHIVVSVITPEPSHSVLQRSYQLYGETNANQFPTLRELVQYYASHSLTQYDQQFLLYAVGQPLNPSGLPDYVDLFYPQPNAEWQKRY